MISREFLESLSFRPFDKYDWMDFQGCETSFPLIAKEDDMTIIVDGNMISVYNDNEPSGFYTEIDKGYDLVWTKF